MSSNTDFTKFDEMSLNQRLMSKYHEKYPCIVINQWINEFGIFYLPSTTSIDINSEIKNPSHGFFS
ncbi:MAG: hypothetical protein ACFFBQ_10400 [Promethearchaeota archaeon]